MKVSVCMTAYNQERFIAQAIESVIMQQADFEYELVIGEDCSADGTREICVNYQQMHPGTIRLLLRGKNLGMLDNFVQTLHACSAEYVAILEGDDYWTTTHKLQRQADFLDASPDYAVCFARTTCLYADAKHKPWQIPLPEYEKPTLTMENLLRCDSIATCSVMFRNHLIRSFPEWFFTLRMGDWPLHIMNAQHGKIGYLPETMAAYRIHSGSNYSSLPSVDILLGNVDFYRAVNPYLDFRYDPLIREMLAQNYQALAIAYLYRMRLLTALRYAIDSVKAIPRKRYLLSISRRNMSKGIRSLKRGQPQSTGSPRAT